MFQERSDLAIAGDAVSDALPPRKTGRASRWETDSIDLKAAIDTARSASARFVESFHLQATHPARSKEQLEQALSQAALARSLLDGFLLRHGRVFMRAEPEDADNMDATGMPPLTVAAEVVEDAKRWRNRSAKNKRHHTQLYRQRRRDKECVKCGQPALPELVLCTKCRAKKTGDLDAGKEADREQQVAATAKKIGGK